MNKKKHVIFVGMPGSGKSSLGYILSKLMWRPFIDTDYYIIKKEKKSISNIFAEQGEENFRELEKKILLEIIENAPSIISTGGGMPCFYNNMDIMNEFATTVYLDVSPENLFDHLKNDKNRPLVKGKTAQELMDYIQSTLEQRKLYYEKADIIIQVSNETQIQLATNLYKIIVNNE
jgi:shikimate kinase